MSPFALRRNTFEPKASFDRVGALCAGLVDRLAALAERL